MKHERTDPQQHRRAEGEYIAIRGLTTLIEKLDMLGDWHEVWNVSTVTAHLCELWNVDNLYWSFVDEN